MCVIVDVMCCAVRQTAVRWRGCVIRPLSVTIRRVDYCHVCPYRKRALCSYPPIHCWLCCTPMKRSEVMGEHLCTFLLFVVFFVDKANHFCLRIILKVFFLNYSIKAKIYIYRGFLAEQAYRGYRKNPYTIKT